MAVDGRRRMYVPMDVHIAFGKFGSALGVKWGLEGIGMWMLFLAACKRERTQGVFVYGSDEEAWIKIGTAPATFTLAEFFKFTGNHKKTSRRTHGRLTYVTCRRWSEWNTVQRQSTDASQTAQTPKTDAQETESSPSAVTENPSKTHVSTDDLDAECVTDTSTEVEVEVELEEDLKPPDQSLSLTPPGTGLEDEEEAETLEQLGARLAARPAQFGTEDRLYEVLTDMDDGSPAVIRTYLSMLPARTIEEVREEVLARAPRSPVKYAVGMLQKRVNGRGLAA